MSRLQRFLVTRAENGGFMVHEKAARLGEHEQLLSCFTNPADFIVWLTAELVGKPQSWWASRIPPSRHRPPAGSRARCWRSRRRKSS